MYQYTFAQLCAIAVSMLLIFAGTLNRSLVTKFMKDNFAWLAGASSWISAILWFRPKFLNWPWLQEEQYDQLLLYLAAVGIAIVWSTGLAVAYERLSSRTGMRIVPGTDPIEVGVVPSTGYLLAGEAIALAMTIGWAWILPDFLTALGRFAMGFRPLGYFGFDSKPAVVFAFICCIGMTFYRIQSRLKVRKAILGGATG